METTVWAIRSGSYMYELRRIQSRVLCREARPPSPGCSTPTTTGVEMWTEKYFWWHRRAMHASQKSCLPMLAQRYDSAIWLTSFCNKSLAQFTILNCFFTFLSWGLGHDFFQQTHEYLTLLLLLSQEKHLKILLLLFLPLLLFSHDPQYILVLLLVLSLLIYKHLILGGFIFLVFLFQFNFFLQDFSLILELLF